jgi:hypothetical protein
MMTKLMRLVVLVVALVAIAGVGGLPRQDVRAVYDEEVVEDETGDAAAADSGAVTTTDGTQQKLPRKPVPTGSICGDLRGDVVYYGQMREFFWSRGVTETSNAFAALARGALSALEAEGCRW